jgi:DNA-directed RNA polymerase specialized sigma24 family protein
MDGPGGQAEARAGRDPDGWIRESYSRILTSCLCAGLASAEADDVAQDIWLWLLRQGPPAVVLSMPWMAAVTRNFILRYRRRDYRRRLRESHPDVALVSRSPEGGSRFEIDELLDRTAARLPETERRLLALIRTGHSLAESARILGIPRGSRSYYQGRVIACARRELHGARPATARRTRRNGASDGV